MNPSAPTPRSVIKDCRRWVHRWRSNWRFLLGAYWLAFWTILIPHHSNNDFRKLTTLILVTGWMALTLGQSAGILQIGVIAYGAMSAVVYTIFGIQWGFEVSGIAPQIEISMNDDDE